MKSLCAPNAWACHARDIAAHAEALADSPFLALALVPVVTLAAAALASRLTR